MATKTKIFKNLFAGLFLLMAPVFLWAQQRTITGRVTAEENGQPLAGISVLVSGTSRGGVTADDGTYSVLASTGETILFSGVGYTPVERAVGQNSVINIVLVTGGGQDLEGVVVTALGIRREAKSLGYSQTTLDSSDLNDAKSSNWTDALSGKVAGLNMVRSGAGPIGSNKIILRGENNLTGDNEALIVIDGVVMGGNARRTANGSEAIYGTGSDNMPADYGSGLNDINPEDIESVTILKGPGAAALYGQRGANGAIIITTKSSRRKQKGWNVTINSNYSVEKINRWPDMQWEYGQGLDGSNYYSYGSGVDGASTSGTSSAYGPRFDGQEFYQYSPIHHGRDSLRSPWVPYTNKIRNYFEDGRTATNSISLDGAIGKVNTRLNYTNVTNKWIMPNTGYDRNSLALALNTKLFKDRLQLTSKINYTNRWSANLPGAGYGNQSIMYWFIFWEPSADLDWLKDYWRYGSARNPDGTVSYWQRKDTAIYYPFSSFPENPYAIAYEFLNKSNRNTITGNISATYNITDDLSLMVRTAGDWGDEFRQQRRPYDAGSRLPRGSVRQQNIKSQEWTSDFLLRYNKQLSADIRTSYNLGGSTLTNTYDRMEVRADSLKVPGLYWLYNAAGDLVYIPNRSKFMVNSIYGMITASYKNFLFADLTGRQDWSSVLASPYRTANVGFFYPSANFSFVLSDAFELPKTISFAKLRFSMAGVGSGGTTPYLNTDVYVPDFNFINDSIYQNPSILANPDMRPLKTVSYELGANAAFFKNRLIIDVAGYIGNTKDQILNRIIDRSAGYTRQVVNAGVVRNTGFELMVEGSPVKIKNGLNWNSTVTFATNKNRIMSMPDTSLVINTGPIAGGQIVAKVGGSMGDLYGRGYVRAPDGQIVYDAVTGNALITQDVLHIGNTIPKIKAGWNNKVSFRNWRLSFLFDGQWGGVAHSLMHYKMVEQGKLAVTLPGRYNGIIGKGVVQNPDGSYRKNDVIAKDIDEYYRSHMGTDNAEGSTFSTDYIKWREARLEFNIPLRGAFSRVGLKRAAIAAYGRDLFIWSPWPMFDPEFGTLSGTDIVRGFEIAQFPSTRTIGGSLLLAF